MKAKKFGRSGVFFVVAMAIIAVFLTADWRQSRQPVPVLPASQRSSLAAVVLSQLAVRPAASKDGYSRRKFSDGWAQIGTCTMRDKILARDMTQVRYWSLADCTVVSGTLNDPYTGKTIRFRRGPGTSAKIQIDHVVAVSDTWRTGAQRLTKVRREQLYNDPLELLAVDGPANEEKGDADASAWLPPNADYDCRYVARQIAIKKKYQLWVTSAEQTAMEEVLKTCPGQLVPSVGS